LISSGVWPVAWETNSTGRRPRLCRGTREKANQRADKRFAISDHKHTPKMRFCYVISKSLIFNNLLRPAGVEPTTFGFGGRHSIQLSYGRESLGS
jgi:hypothetical protein